MRNTLILIISILLITNVVEARMYQWTEPGVETTQLSGKPPAWYRSAAGGPRIFVFDNGRLIDDTAVEVSAEVRQRMRQQAFVLAEEDRQKAQEKMTKAQELKQKYKKSKNSKSAKTNQDELEIEESNTELVDDELVAEDNKSEEGESGITDKRKISERRLVKEWEAAQTKSAKQTLE